jgi:hypothetical protein
MRIRALSLAVVGLVALSAGAGGVPSDELSLLSGDFNLAPERSAEPQVFAMKSELITYAPDGKRVSKDVFRVWIRAVPAGVPDKWAGEYTCLRFTVEFDGKPETALPALENWTYTIDPRGIDERGQVFGIDHAKFEGLVDASGNALPVDKQYHVYNAFIDFHGFCDVFAQPAPGGSGIQDLRRIGDVIVHEAAFSEAPTNLGAGISEGSSFTNGEIKLEFKGLSEVNGAACGLVGYDSGESSFKMIVNPMPDMTVVTVGSSHYWGDIYKNLASGWVEKAEMTEMVVSETALPMPPGKLNGVIERHVTIRNVTHAEE